MTLFINGVEVGSFAEASSVQSVRPLWFGGSTEDGNNTNANCEFLDGILDEIRVETVARSAIWLAASVANGRGSYVAIGPVEILPP
jgi:hypothetical protein